jgi:hypothetical protein
MITARMPFFLLAYLIPASRIKNVSTTRMYALFIRNIPPTLQALNPII